MRHHPEHDRVRALQIDDRAQQQDERARSVEDDAEQTWV